MSSMSRPKNHVLRRLSWHRHTVHRRYYNWPLQECNGTGQRCCTVCGGSEEIEAALGATSNEREIAGKFSQYLASREKLQTSSREGGLPLCYAEPMLEADWVKSSLKRLVSKRCGFSGGSIPMKQGYRSRVLLCSINA